MYNQTKRNQQFFILGFQSIGRIADAQVRIGERNFTIDLDVIERLPGDIWLGTDFLKSYRCTISPQELIVSGLDGSATIAPIFTDESDDIMIGVVQMISPAF